MNEISTLSTISMLAVIGVAACFFMLSRINDRLAEISKKLDKGA